MKVLRKKPVDLIENKTNEFVLFSMRSTKLRAKIELVGQSKANLYKKMEYLKIM